MKAAHPLREVAGWLIVVALVYAPLAFGSIPQPALMGLEGLLALATLSWVLDALVQRKLPSLPPLLVACCVWLLLQGWAMAWNAHSTFTANDDILSITSPLPSAPGAVERVLAVQAMLRMTAILAALLIVVDLAQYPPWKMRLLWTMAWTGAGFSVFGLVQQAGLVHFVAEQMNPYEGIYFSTYNYHGNAGAFLNLAIPAICALFFVAQSEKQSIGRRLLLGGLFTCCLIATLVNFSRGAQAITVVMLVGLGIWGGLRLAQGDGRRARKALLILTGVCLGCLFLGGALLPHLPPVVRDWEPLQRVVQKWERLPESLSTDSGRGQVWPIDVAMARQSGPFGKGPGAFKLLLPSSPLLNNAFYSRWINQMPNPARPTSMWSQAHEDYLQTIIEFGWLGGLAAETILFGGIISAWRAVQRDQNRTATFLHVGGLAALLAVAVHSLFDFPQQVASLQLYIAVYLGFAWATVSPSHSIDSPSADSTSLQAGDLHPHGPDHNQTA